MPGSEPADAQAHDPFGRARAQALDSVDPLAPFASRVHQPAEGTVYLDGNSLGLLPRATPAALTEVVAREWGRRLIRSWEHWIDLATSVGDEIAAGVLEARSGEVVVGDSTTVSLYKLAAAALDARPGRRVLLTDDDNFPTDTYVFQGLAQARGLELRVLPTDVDAGLDPAAVEAALDDDVALVSFSHVAYRSGALADLPVITGLAHRVGALTLWDLSHSAGSVPVPLTSSGADLAVGCTYKYLCGGPGAPAFSYVRRELQEDLRQPIWGWFGQRDQFAMTAGYEPAAGIGRFQVGTPPVLGLTAVREGVRLVADAGLPALRAKGMAITAYLLELAEEWLRPLGFGVATPADPERRGSHVTLRHPQAWPICQALVAEWAVIPDYRPPQRLRLGPAPLTTSYTQVWDGLDRIRRLVAAGGHEGYPTERGRVT